MNPKRVITFFAGLAIVIGVLVVNQWVFTSWFQTSYLQWYLGNGALVALVTTATSLAWGDINKHTGLISSHPLDYLGACLQLIGLPVYTIGVQLKSIKNQREAYPIFDLFLTVPCLLALLAVVTAWLVVIAPPQYLAYLICGAPARIFSQSDWQSIARMDGFRLEIKEINKEKELPSGWWNASLSQKPVAITNLFVAMFLLIFKLLKVY